jgi:hypothetical protein
MAMALHHRADELMAFADFAFMRGDDGEGKSLLAQAAQCELDAFLQAPIDKVQTRGILAASAVALFRRANLTIQAERAAHQCLAQDGVPDETRAGLEEAIYDMRAEQIERAQGRILAPDRFEWKLEGRSIGTGTAPMAVVSHKIGQIEKYAVRVVEYVAGEPLRTQQPLSDRMRDSMSLVMSQPMAGSFRFALRLSVSDEQMALFDEGRPEGAARVKTDPAQIGTKFFEVLEAVLEDDQASLEVQVPEPEYRETFIHLVRNMVPDGRDLTTMQVTRLGTDTPSTAILTPKLRAPLDRRIRAMRPPRPRGAKELDLVDLLRGVDLNSRSVKLGFQDHERVCRAEDDFLMVADVLEGMLDEPVRVTGRRTRGGGFRFTTIVSATREELEDYRRHEAEETALLELAPERRTLRAAEPHVRLLEPGDEGK